MDEDVFLITLDEKERRGGPDVDAAIHIINQLLIEGVPVHWAREGFQIANRSYPAGTFCIQTPFSVDRGIPWKSVLAWLEDKLTSVGVNGLYRTSGPVLAKSERLMVPKIALYYDRITYDNALMHYLTFRSLGFLPTLVSARDLLQDPDDPESIFASSNVFVMPGGSLHFASFSSALEARAAIENIRRFIRRGGGYIGVCAGATEALIKSPYPYLNLVDASYHSEWFMPGDPTRGDWEWRSLLGRLFLEIVDPDHPVMFGYGESAVLPGYGPQVAVEYFGGPSMFDLGDSVKVLARYSAPIDQTPCSRVQDIWGSAAIVASHFGSGRVVLFGPHPEWPGLCHRMYAQALFYVARQSKPSIRQDISGQPLSSKEHNVSIPLQHVAFVQQSVQQTVTAAAPVLDRCIELCERIVKLGAGDRKDPLGVWYDKTLLTFARAIKTQMDEIRKSAQELYLEYERLDSMASRFAKSSRELEWIVQSRSMIDQFFSYASGLPFSELLPVIFCLEEEIEKVDLPCIERYARLLAQCRGLHEICTDDTGTDDATPGVRDALEKLHQEISSWQPPGHMYRAMGTLRHTLNVMQYKIDIHLLNLLTLADQAKDMQSLTDYGVKKETIF